MGKERMEAACIVDITVRVAGIDEGSSPRSKRKYINTDHFSLVRTKHIQKLDVPGEALVQGREIGLRDGSHLARQFITL